MNSSTWVSPEFATRAMTLAVVFSLISVSAKAEETMSQLTFRLPAAGEPTLFLRHQPPMAARGVELSPVLYIHGATFPSALSVGFGFDGYSWMDDLSAAGFSVWALDFAGYGESDRYSPSWQSSKKEPLPGRSKHATEQIDRAVRWIMEYEGAAQVSLVAHSWGTIAAGRFAGDNPERIDRLVLFGPIARREQSTNEQPLGATRLVSIEDQHARFIKDVPPTHSPVLLERHFRSWAAGYLASDPESTANDPPAVRVPSGPIADLRRAWSGELSYDPERITAPTLIVRGEWDSVSTDLDARWLFDALKSARLKRDVKIAKATHLMHLETARHELYAVTRSFLASVTERADRLPRSSAIAVLFEVYPKPGHREEYIEIATHLRPKLESIDGFLSIERFESLSQEGKILSLSLWRDETAVAAWRNQVEHRDAQARGRRHIFHGYRLRVASVIRDYGMLDRTEAPQQLPEVALGDWDHGSRQADRDGTK